MTYYFDYYYGNLIRELLQIFSFVSDFNVTVLIVLAFRIVTAYMVMEKTGERGWKGLIPIYKTYLEFKQYWQTSLFWLYLAMPFVVSALLLTGILSGSQSLLAVFVVLASIVLLCKFIFRVMLQIRKSNCFNEDVLFGIGLLLLNTIFVGVLALDKKCVYVGNCYSAPADLDVQEESEENKQ